jgi:hypothetical protein
VFLQSGIQRPFLAAETLILLSDHQTDPRIKDFFMKGVIAHGS